MDKQIYPQNIIIYLRRIIQLIFFLFLPGLFIQIFLSIKTIILFLIYQQYSIQAAFPSILLLLVTTITTAFFGRFFCGWMCAFGSMSDFLYRIFRRKKTNSPSYIVKPKNVDSLGFSLNSYLYKQS